MAVEESELYGYVCYVAPRVLARILTGVRRYCVNQLLIE